MMKIAMISKLTSKAFLEFMIFTLLFLQIKESGLNAVWEGL